MSVRPRVIVIAGPNGAGKSTTAAEAVVAPKSAGNPDNGHKRVIAAARSAVRKALRAHKAAGDSIVVWKDGKIVKIPASKISA